MKKSSIVTMMAVLLSLGFCVLYFGLFARISETSSAPEDSLEVTVTPGTQPESAAPGDFRRSGIIVAELDSGRGVRAGKLRA